LNAEDRISVIDLNNSLRMKTRKRILVTGVAGFLGSHLLDNLLENNHYVIGIDNLSMGSYDNISHNSNNNNFEFIKGDITKFNFSKNISSEIDVIVHLAAFKIPRYGNAIDTLTINNKGTEVMLDFAKERNCKCVIASTSDVYGNCPDIPFKESSVNCIGSSKIPRWGYAVSKLYDEHLAFAYQDTFGIPVTLLRFFGSYGPRQHRTWWGGPQSVFINSLFYDEPIPIHGNGLQTRTFTYVSDTVAGIYAAIFNPNANGEIINIGANSEITIVDLAKTIHKLSGLETELKLKFIPYDEINPGTKYEDVIRRVPDNTLCKKLLGVSAQVSLEEGLKKTIVWQIKKIEQEALILVE